jgi:hypothetical protein
VEEHGDDKSERKEGGKKKKQTLIETIMAERKG